MAGLGLVVLRLVLGVIFVAHGTHILFGTWAGPGIGPGGLHFTAEQYATFGLHPEMILATAAGIAQLAGGVLLAMGFLTRLASTSLLIYLGVGAWKVHVQWGFFLNWTHASQQGHGIEYSLMLAGALVCLLLTSGGEWSIDGQLAQSRASRAAGRARLRGKI